MNLLKIKDCIISHGTKNKHFNVVELVSSSGGCGLHCLWHRETAGWSSRSTWEWAERCNHSFTRPPCPVGKIKIGIYRNIRRIHVSQLPHFSWEPSPTPCGPSITPVVRLTDPRRPMACRFLGMWGEEWWARRMRRKHPRGWICTHLICTILREEWK